MFYKGSRYEKVKDANYVDESGQVRPYKKVRFIPPTAGQLKHTVTAGERPDHLAFRYYKDSERFWRICDANGVLWSDDLVDEAGKVVQIPSAS